MSPLDEPLDQPRVVLHVGLPKAGSSYLQSLLQRLPVAPASGPCHPEPNGATMFLAALDVTGNHARWGRTREQVAGQWERLCARAREHAGPTVISSELLTYASARAAADALAHLDGVDVDLVVAAREPAGLLPSRWQQGIKTGHEETFEEFLERSLGAHGDDPDARYWRNIAPLHMLRIWGAGLPSERIHLVTVPTGPAPPELLWERFAEAARIPADLVPTGGERANESLGIAAVELLRRVNAHVVRKDDPRRYAVLVRRLLVRRLLIQHASPRPVLPDEWFPTVEALAAGWRERIEDAGYPVVGTLDDLAPRRRDGAVAASDDEVVGLAAETIGALLNEIGERDARIRRLERRAARVGRGAGGAAGGAAGGGAGGGRPRLARRVVRRLRGG